MLCITCAVFKRKMSEFIQENVIMGDVSLFKISQIISLYTRTHTHYSHMVHFYNAIWSGLWCTLPSSLHHDTQKRLLET